MSEEQLVQVQHQADIQRAQVLLELVVLGIAVARQFLIRSGYATSPSAG